MSDTLEVSRDKLVADFKAVVADAEELLRVTAGLAGDKAAEVRGRVQERLTQAKADLSDAQASIVEKAKAAGHATDEYVHENPWRSIGIAAGVGLVVGLLIGRR